MSRVLLVLGIGCCFVAIITGMVSLDVDARGFSEVNPLGALALAVAGLACFRGHERLSVVDHDRADHRSPAGTRRGQ